MPTIFDYLYREYCRARLAEMRKQLRLIPGPAAPDSNCDISHPVGPDDLDRDLSEEGKTTKREASHIH